MHLLFFLFKLVVWKEVRAYQKANPFIQLHCVGQVGISPP